MRTIRLGGFAAVALAVAGLAAAPVCFAQAYPSAPVRVVVGFPPGGVADVLARIIQPRLAEGLGQPVVVENRPGAGSNIAAEQVARATPDGHTLFVFSSANAVNVSLYSRLNYDPVKDFTQISMIASMANLLVVNPSLPVQTVRELIALAKSRPGQLQFGSAGNGSTQHISGQLFAMMAGVDIVHVPYKGSVPAMTGLLGGEIPFMFNVMSTALPHVKSGKARALAITTAQRSPLLPDLPTVAESGVPGFDYIASFGIQAPARTPAPVVARLNAELGKVLQNPDVRERFAVNGAEAIHTTPEQFAAFIQNEVERHRPIIRATGAKVD